MNGYFTAGILLCFTGLEPSYDTCMAYRSPTAYPTEQMCQEAIVNEFNIISDRFNLELYDIISIKCDNWLEDYKDTPL